MKGNESELAFVVAYFIFCILAVVYVVGIFLINRKKNKVAMTSESKIPKQNENKVQP